MVIVNARFLTQPITGVQRFCIEISLQLKKMIGNEILFVSPKNIIHTDIAKQLQVKTYGHMHGHLWEQIELPIFLNKNSNVLLLNLANTAPILYKNKVSTIHDVAYLPYPQSYSRTFRTFYKVLMPRILKTSKKIITVSNFSKQELVKYYNISTGKIFVVYNAVDRNVFKPCNATTVVKEKYLLAVSSVNYRKNFTSILNAYIKSDIAPEVKLYIIGDLKGKNFGQIDLSQFKNNKNIVFLGRVTDDELVKYYQNAWGFAYPSLYEGFGIPPLEAQACGCPVIVSEKSSLPEIFKNSAIYCNPFSINDIAKKMRYLAMLPSQQRQTLINKGRENCEDFSWNESAKRLCAFVSG